MATSNADTSRHVPRRPVQTAPADDRRRDAHVTDGFPPGPGSGHTILTG